MVRRWTVRLAACLVVGPLLLGGCGQKHQASDSLPPTKSAPATKGLAPLGPADFPVPAEARQKTPAGVTAFTRYYIELLNRQLQTRESAPIRDLSSSCATCSALADSYDRAKAEGKSYDGGTISVSSTGTATVSGDEGEISFLLQQAAVTVRNAQGAVLPEGSKDGVTLGGGLRVAWDKSRSTWLVTQFDANKV